jgi:signal transduction histidine kinase
VKVSTDAKLTQPELEALQNRRAPIAAQWYDAIATDIPDLNDADVKVQLENWVRQTATLLSQKTPEWGMAQAVGETIAREVSSKARVLGKTQEVLARQFAKDLAGERLVALVPRLSRLLGELATGFVDEQAKHVQTMRRKFLSTTSHDMRSPLNAVIGFSRIIVKGVDGPVTDLQTQDLNTIHESGKNLLKMIDDVFSIDKVEAGSISLDTKTFSLSDVVDSAIDAVQPAIDENENTLAVNRAEPSPFIESDPAKVKQVLVNLLGHATRFTKQGTITLDISQTTEDGADWVVFQVSDTGLGLTPAQIERFGAAASPSAPSYDDITLMVTQRYSQLLGGQLTVEAGVGKGSTFTLRLPAKPAAP